MAIYTKEIGINGSSESEEFFLNCFYRKIQPVEPKGLQKKKTQLYNLACDIVLSDKLK